MSDKSDFGCRFGLSYFYSYNLYVFAVHITIKFQKYGKQFNFIKSNITLKKEVCDFFRFYTYSEYPNILTNKSTALMPCKWFYHLNSTFRNFHASLHCVTYFAKNIFLVSVI